jgi:hypothetical protein
LKTYVICISRAFFWDLFEKVSKGRFLLLLGFFVDCASFEHVVDSFEVFLGLGAILKNGVKIGVDFWFLKAVIIGVEIGDFEDVRFYLKDEGSDVLEKIS